MRRCRYWWNRATGESRWSNPATEIVAAAAAAAAAAQAAQAAQAAAVHFVAPPVQKRLEAGAAAAALAGLPASQHWEQHHDSGSGRTYWWNSITGESRWAPVAVATKLSEWACQRLGLPTAGNPTVVAACGRLASGLGPATLPLMVPASAMAEIKAAKEAAEIRAAKIRAAKAAAAAAAWGGGGRTGGAASGSGFGRKATSAAPAAVKAKAQPAIELLSSSSSESDEEQSEGEDGEDGSPARGSKWSGAAAVASREALVGRRVTSEGFSGTVTKHNLDDKSFNLSYEDGALQKRVTEVAVLKLLVPLTDAEAAQQEAAAKERKQQMKQKVKESRARKTKTKAKAAHQRKEGTQENGQPAPVAAKSGGVWRKRGLSPVAGSGSGAAAAPATISVVSSSEEDEEEEEQEEDEEEGYKSSLPASADGGDDADAEFVSINEASLNRLSRAVSVVMASRIIAAREGRDEDEALHQHVSYSIAALATYWL